MLNEEYKESMMRASDAVLTSLSGVKAKGKRGRFDASASAEGTGSVRVDPRPSVAPLCIGATTGDQTDFWKLGHSMAYGSATRRV